MDDETLARILPPLLNELWDIDPADVRPLGGGMNSATCLVTTTAGDLLVAKWSSDAQSLEAGSSAAAALGAAGFRAGEPLRLGAGGLTADVSGGGLALLRHVPGRELDGESEHEQRLIATTLATVHAAGGPELHTGPFMSEWLSPADDVLGVAGWLPAALADVRREYDALPPLTWSQLHTDPTPEAFLHDKDTGVTGLIDWAGSCRGPVLYDVASAVMYLGGPDRSERFLAAYGDGGPLDEPELSWLESLRRFRWAIQASYYAGRILADDQTGILDDPEHNRDSLARARRGIDEV